jgi:hypothetical protein
MAWAPEESVNQKHSDSGAAPKKQTQWVAERAPHCVVRHRLGAAPALRCYFTSFQYEAFSRQAKTVRMLRKINTMTPSWKRWPCAGSPIHCM